MANQNKLKAYVRYDGTGRVIAGGPILQRFKPKVGNWVEIDAKECCNYVPTTTTTTTAVPGLSVRISSNEMFDPVCTASTTLLVQVTSGTSLSDALTITGDFASLGAYYTPVDPNDIMAQPPTFRIAYLVGGVLKNRQFKLTDVGVASGYDGMFGLTQEGTCS
jgi:hypothetical protein